PDLTVQHDERDPRPRPAPAPHEEARGLVTCLIVRATEQRPLTPDLLGSEWLGRDLGPGVGGGADAARDDDDRCKEVSDPHGPQEVQARCSPQAPDFSRSSSRCEWPGGHSICRDDDTQMNPSSHVKDGWEPL